MGLFDKIIDYLDNIGKKAREDYAYDKVFKGDKEAIKKHKKFLKKYQRKFSPKEEKEYKEAYENFLKTDKV